MQNTSVLVNLNGSNSMIIPKHGITVAEFMVLAAGNGIEHVTEIPGTERGESKVNHAAEYSRLVQTYGQESVTKCFGPSPFGVNMPTRFSDIGINADNEDDEDEDEPVAPVVPVKPEPVAPVVTPVADKPAELKLEGKPAK